MVGNGALGWCWNIRMHLISLTGSWWSISPKHSITLELNDNLMVSSRCVHCILSCASNFDFNNNPNLCCLWRLDLQDVGHAISRAPFGQCRKMKQIGIENIEGNVTWRDYAKLESWNDHKFGSAWRPETAELLPLSRATALQSLGGIVSLHSLSLQVASWWCGSMRFENSRGEHLAKPLSRRRTYQRKILRVYGRKWGLGMMLEYSDAPNLIDRKLVKHIPEAFYHAWIEWQSDGFKQMCPLLTKLCL